MDTQQVFNIFITILVGTMGWFARTIWDAIKELRDDLHNVEVHLPNNYVKQVDINSRFDKLESMMERIFDRLDQKQDKTL
jgi:type II secretory pathway component PulF